jgi:hypothetical protein
VGSISFAAERIKSKLDVVIAQKGVANELPQVTGMQQIADDRGSQPEVLINRKRDARFAVTYRMSRYLSHGCYMADTV